MSAIKIKMFCFSSTPAGAGDIYSVRDKISITYITENRNGQNQDWIIVKRDGVELSRHNPRFVASIIWDMEEKYND